MTSLQSFRTMRNSLSAPCGSLIGTDGLEVTSDTDAYGIHLTPTIAKGQTLMIHQGWSVAWNESDILAMSAEMPLLTTTIHIPMWNPGQETHNGEYHRWPDYTNAGFISQSLLLFMCIWIPLIFVSFFGSCIFCCVRIHRKKKRERQGWWLCMIWYCTMILAMIMTWVM